MAQAELWRDTLATLTEAALLNRQADGGVEQEGEAAGREQRRRALLARCRALVDEFDRTQQTAARRASGPPRRRTSDGGSPAFRAAAERVQGR